MATWNIRSLMSSVPPSVTPKENLRRARGLLREARADELFVLDGGKLVGTLSERDIWQHCPTSALVLDDHQTEELLAQFRVGGVMALHPPIVAPETTLQEAVRLFGQSGRHGLPVVEDGVPIGLLTEEKVMQAVALLLREVEQDGARAGDKEGPHGAPERRNK
jgi:acetoin utilization protein AcuB